MSNLTGYPQVFEADTSTVDTTAKHQLGTRSVDKDGNEFIYLQGVASTAAKLAVTYDEAYATTLLAANAVGAVAVAMAATVANTYGWYQVKGSATATAAGAVADNKALYIAGSGKVDDAAVAGDYVVGMWSRGTAAADGDDLTVQLDYPKVSDGAYLT